MLGKEFDLVLSAILLVLTIAFFIGKGEGILRLFSGNNYRGGKTGNRKSWNAAVVFSARFLRRQSWRWHFCRKCGSR